METKAEAEAKHKKEIAVESFMIFTYNRVVGSTTPFKPNSKASTTAAYEPPQSIVPFNSRTSCTDTHTINPREVRMSVQAKIMTSFQCYFSTYHTKAIPYHMDSSVRPADSNTLRFKAILSVLSVPVVGSVGSQSSHSSHHIFAITAIGAHTTIAVVV